MRNISGFVFAVVLFGQLWAATGLATTKTCHKYCNLAYRDCVAPTPWPQTKTPCSRLKSPKLKESCLNTCRAAMHRCKIDQCSDPSEEFTAEMKARLEKEKIFSSKENNLENVPNKNR